MTPSGIEPAAFRLVAQCLVPNSDKKINGISTELLTSV